MTAHRDSRSLDGEWRFVPDPERLHRDPVDLPDGEPIRVPGCWEAQVRRPDRIVHAWYARDVEVPGDWRGDRVVLAFGAVMERATVYLNGERLATHDGGYLPFEVEAGPAVRWDGPNRLAVHVTNPANALDRYPAFRPDQLREADALVPELPLTEVPHGKQTWYSSQSGLWQSVRMERRPAVALGPLRATPDVPGGAVTVDWSLDGDRPADGRFELAIEVSDPDGRPVAATTLDPLAAGGGGRVRLAIPDARLWDIDRPNLYRIDARLARDDRWVDALGTRFGMREIATRDGRLLLNGRPIYLLGVLDQDLYPDSISTPSSRAELDDQIRRARELGINTLRCHIKVPDPAYLDAADEAGMLVWAELPNWVTFSDAAAARGRATLAGMVAALGNHPSIVAWTIINEDWGTDLRHEARDRAWLGRTFDWLKALDPSRLVVDNSACETAERPNFHVATDLADFHLYRRAPDQAVRWRDAVAEFAERPGWLWSPHGDARPRGDEPLVLSEFGSWGLPRIDRLREYYGGRPWWFATGRDFYAPSGVEARFAAHGLDRIWESVDALAEATQWHQFEALQYQIGELRRHDTIQGYVITELSDAYWEANGLLDAMRGPKVYHDRFREINAPVVVVATPDRRDQRAGDDLGFEVVLSSYDPVPPDGGTVEWQVLAADVPGPSGTIAIDRWPAGGVAALGHVRTTAPAVRAPTDGRLRLVARDRDGTVRAESSIRLALLPAEPERAIPRRTVRVDEPAGTWSIEERLAALGHRVAGPAGRPDPADAADELIVASRLSPELARRVEAGAHALVLVRDRAAIPAGVDLARPVRIRARDLPDPDRPDERGPWDGDWVTNFSWIDHARLPGLPERNPLDFAYAEVLPDHVLAGYDPARHRDEVPAGMFAGWIHAPAALAWTFPQGRGRLTLTTFRLAPEAGPLADALLEALLDVAAAERSGDGIDASPTPRPPARSGT